MDSGRWTRCQDKNSNHTVKLELMVPMHRDVRPGHKEIQTVLL